jgi:hypothetical protein
MLSGAKHPRSLPNKTTAVTLRFAQGDRPSTLCRRSANVLQRFPEGSL